MANKGKRKTKKHKGKKTKKQKMMLRQIWEKIKLNF